MASDSGFDIFLKPVAISSYSIINVLLPELVSLNPSAITIVDTLGALNHSSLASLLSDFDSCIPSNIDIGIHLHQNQNLALSLAFECIRHFDTSRNFFLDASLVGMGRIPGNLSLENLLLNLDCSDRYSYSSLLYSIHQYILPIKAKTPWGYSPAYQLSAIYNVNRNYPEYFLNLGYCLSDMASPVSISK